MKIIKFLIICLVMAAICYVFYFNPEDVEIVYAKAKSFKAPLALILITTFFTGALVTLIFSIINGIKFKVKNKKLIKQKKLTDEHIHLIDKARSSLALGNFTGAEKLFKKIINKDADNISARVGLSKTYLGQQNYEQALVTLEEARAEDKKNPELLLAASDLNARMGKYTAAYDNAALVLKMMPKNKYALQRLAEDCIPLERFEEATKYLRELIRLADADEMEEIQHQLAETEFFSALKIDDDSEFKSKIKDITSRHKNYTRGIIELAEIEEKEKNLDKAEKLYIKAYKVDNNSDYIKNISSMWLNNDKPKKAISTLEKLIKEADKNGKDSTDIKYALALVQFELENLEGAEKTLTPILESSSQDIKLLEAKLLAKKGLKDLAFEKLSTFMENSN